MDLSRYNKPVNLSGPSNFFNNMSARATSTSQMVLQHGMNMEAAHHGNELAKDLASHQGGIASALSAQGHEQSSALSAQEHGQRLKETAATNRHIIKKTILDHNNDLEKRAVDHHLSTDKLRTESGLRVTESNNTSNNTINEAGVAHRHAGELINRIAAAGQGGKPAEFSGNGVTAKFTLKMPDAPGPTNPPPTVAPSQAKKMIHVTPVTRTNTPAPAPAPTATGGPKPTVKRAPNGRMVSLKETTPTAAPAKKATAKKVAPTKGQPTVTRDKTTGRMIGIKKK
jgi:hypothetical protein